ncbi:MAG: discoidin domain-containing protein [Bacteroidales bacterium]|nr:discoidin domain-containing protein [Bacteroidales bacterium]
MKRLIITLTTLLAVSLGSMAQEALITRSSQLSSPFTDNTEGSYSNLLDSDLSTFWHSDWHHGRVQPHFHYLQVELDKPIKGDVTATIGRRYTSYGVTYPNNNPIVISVEASSDGKNFVDVAQMNFPFNPAVPIMTECFHLKNKAKYLRFYCDKTNGNVQEGWWHLSEFQLNQGDKPIHLPTPKGMDKISTATAGSTKYVMPNPHTTRSSSATDGQKTLKEGMKNGSIGLFSRQNLLGDQPYKYLVGSSSEKGYDRLDSIYYLNINTYAMPFYKEKDKQKVMQYILRIMETYDKISESSEGGFKHVSPLEFGPAEESKRVSMYYAEELEPFVIGGKGRNYVVVRQQDPHNINYRTCEGVEWWLEVPGANPEMLDRVYDPRAKKNAVVKFRVFNLYGPLTEQHYERAFNKLLPPLPGGTNNSFSELLPPIPVGTNNSFNETIEVNSSPAQMANGLLMQIRVLGELYKNNGSTTDDAVVYSINERVTKYLSISCRSASDIFSEENRQLYRVLGKIPGYGASVCYPDGIVVTGSFELLANHYPQATQFEMNWYTKGDAKCTGECCNFLLEINVKKITNQKP